MKTKMNELYDLVMGSPELQKRFVEICAEQEAESPEAVQAALVAFIAELGFIVTAEEVSAFFEGLQKGGELSESELDMVAGGMETKTGQAIQNAIEKSKK